MGQLCCKQEQNDIAPTGSNMKKKESMQSLRPNASSVSPDIDASVPSLGLFALQRSLGKGAFGKVRVVQHLISNQVFPSLIDSGLRLKIHQQGEMYTNASSGKHHSREEVIGGNHFAFCREHEICIPGQRKHVHGY